VTVLNGQPELLVNEAPAASWLGIRLVGHTSNRDGVGARVTVRAGDRVWMSEREGGRSYLAASDPRLHFGLGAVRQVALRSGPDHPLASHQPDPDRRRACVKSGESCVRKDRSPLISVRRGCYPPPVRIVNGCS
jgi:hypothetical protein